MSPMSVLSNYLYCLDIFLLRLVDRCEMISTSVKVHQPATSLHELPVGFNLADEGNIDKIHCTVVQLAIRNEDIEAALEFQ